MADHPGKCAAAADQRESKVVEALIPWRSVDPMSAEEPAASVSKASAGMLAILYDGSCQMCRASLDGIRQFDNSGKMEPLDLHDEAVRAKFPELKMENLLEELHAVDESGRVYRGARAINVAEPLVFYRVGARSFKRRGGAGLSGSRACAHGTNAHDRGQRGF